jgi:hypothetical protein
MPRGCVRWWQALSVALGETAGGFGPRHLRVRRAPARSRPGTVSRPRAELSPVCDGVDALRLPRQKRCRMRGIILHVQNRGRTATGGARRPGGGHKPIGNEGTVPEGRQRTCGRIEGLTETISGCGWPRPTAGAFEGCRNTYGILKAAHERKVAESECNEARLKAHEEIGTTHSRQY